MMRAVLRSRLYCLVPRSAVFEPGDFPARFGTAFGTGIVTGRNHAMERCVAIPISQATTFETATHFAIATVMRPEDRANRCIVFLPDTGEILYMYFEDATWRLGKLPIGVYPLRPKTRKWQVNQNQDIEARLNGYPLLPDFCSTVHDIQSATLEAAFWALLDANQNIAPAEQIAGYVVLDRVRHLHRRCILQPFSPLLFSRGPPQSPALLFRKLQVAYTKQEALDVWQEDLAFADIKAPRLDPLGNKDRCMSSHRQKKPSNRTPEKVGTTDRRCFDADFKTQVCGKRCVSCAAAKNLPIFEPTVELEQNTASRQESSDKATKSCIHGVEKCRDVKLQIDHHVCSGCRRELACHHFSANSIKEYLSPHKKTVLICNECRARGCITTDANLYDCAGCARRLGKRRYDKLDWDNKKRKTGRYKTSLFCGCGTNSCSTMAT